jgi:integrase
MVEKYWKPYFKGKVLGEVSGNDIEEFINSLGNTAPSNGIKSPKRNNNIILAGTIPLSYAYKKGLIDTDITKGILKFSGKAKKRGILTIEEVKILFQMEWPNEKSKLINIVAMMTGLRLGEIMALKKDCVGNDYLFIKYSYNPTDGLKTTKTNEVRKVPILPGISSALLKIAEDNPHDDGFVFYSEFKDNPLGSRFPSEDLQNMLAAMKICYPPIRKGKSWPGFREAWKKYQEQKKEIMKYWKERNIVFHSWRHFFSTLMAEKIDSRKVMLVTGHKTEAVFESYSAHVLESDFRDVSKATQDVFSTLLENE